MSSTQILFLGGIAGCDHLPRPPHRPGPERPRRAEGDAQRDHDRRAPLPALGRAHHAVEPVEAALAARGALLGPLRRPRRSSSAASASVSSASSPTTGGCGARANDDRPGTHHGRVAATPRARKPASWLAFLIAIGIGLHNFSEGLAIGQSAASGDTAWPSCSSSGSPCTTPPKASGSPRRSPATRRPTGATSRSSA